MDHGLQLIWYVYWKMPLMIFINDQITVVFPASVRETGRCAIIALNILSGFFLSTAWENSSVEAWEFQSTLPHGE